MYKTKKEVRNSDTQIHSLVYISLALLNNIEIPRYHRARLIRKSRTRTRGFAASEKDKEICGFRNTKFDSLRPRNSRGNTENT